MRIWECKIGIADDVELPNGADYPMRLAVGKEFINLTGKEPDFLFSGWGGELTQIERDVIEHQKKTTAAVANSSTKEK